MYVPRQFREERPSVLAEAVRSIGFATLVSPHAAELQISHVPMFLKAAGDAGKLWTLESHVARANPHWQAVRPDVRSVAIFQGAQAYISPSWYAAKREHGRVVPTWNYIAVHLSGQLEIVEGAGWLHAHLCDLTNANEAARNEPWAVDDAPADYLEGMMRGIVGLRMTVTSVQGAWKMAQHRSEADRLGTIDGLEADPHGFAVANVMRELEVARTNDR